MQSTRGWEDNTESPWNRRGKFGGPIETPNFPRHIYGPPTPRPPCLCSRGCCCTRTPCRFWVVRDALCSCSLFFWGEGGAGEDEPADDPPQGALSPCTARRKKQQSNALLRPRGPRLRRCSKATPCREVQHVAGQYSPSLKHHPTAPNRRNHLTFMDHQKKEPPNSTVPKRAETTRAVSLMQGVVLVMWGSQGVRFASPQSAPTAPATTACIALSSVCQTSVFAYRVFNGWGQGQGPIPSPLYQVGCSLSGCVRGKHLARRTPVCPVNRLAGPFLHRLRGVYGNVGGVWHKALV